LAFDRQASALVIIEEDSALADLFLEDLILGAKVLDDLLLLPIDPACQDDEEQLLRLKNEVHG